MLEQCPAKLEPLIIQILEHSLVLKKNLVLLHFLLKTPKSPNAGALSSWNGTSSNPNTVCTSSWKSRSWFFHIFYWSLQHSPNAGALSSWTTSPNIYLQLNNKSWFYHIFHWGLQFILNPGELSIWTGALSKYWSWTGRSKFCIETPNNQNSYHYLKNLFFMVENPSVCPSPLWDETRSHH